MPAVLDALQIRHENGRFLCPAHDDHTPSADFNGETDRLWHCFSCRAGGDAYDLVKTVKQCGFKEAAEWIEQQGLVKSHDLAKPLKKPSLKVHRGYPEALLAARYSVQLKKGRNWEPSLQTEYRHPDGSTAFYVVRFEPPDKSDKDIRQISQAEGGYVCKGYAGKRPLLDVCNLDKSLPVVIVEGEKACEAARKIGLQATTWAGGSEAVGKTDWQSLKGFEVTIWPDRDKPGIEAAYRIGRILGEMAKSVTILPVEAEKMDGHDAADALQELGPDQARRYFEDLKAKASTEIKTTEPVEEFPIVFRPDIVWPNTPPHDDLHRAEFIKLMFNGRVLYCEQNASWMMYQDGRWTESRKLAYQLAKSLPRLLAEIASQHPSSKEWYAAAVSASNIKAVDSALRWLQTDLMIDINDLDNDPWLLNLKNGTLDLRTGGFRPHDPADLISKQSPVEYDPTADCPMTKATLEMFQPCPEMRELILQFAGYSLTGVISDLALPIWYGPLANNGKSTISEALRCVLGPDYSMSLDIEFLIGNKRQASDEYHIAQLKGMRHVLFEEPDQNATLRPKTLKALVDNRSEMTGRHPHGRPFRFRPSWKCHVVTNHKPNIKATDNGTWRRLLLVPFEVTIDPSVDKKDFKQELFKERAGILNMLVQACQRWQKQGQLAVPKSVREATAELRVSSDPIGQFILERCVIGNKDYRVKAGVLYRNYLEFMELNTDLGDPQSATSFGRYIGERYKKNSDKSYVGIGLKN